MCKPWVNAIIKPGLLWVPMLAQCLCMSEFVMKLFVLADPQGTKKSASSTSEDMHLQSQPLLAPSAAGNKLQQCCICCQGKCAACLRWVLQSRACSDLPSCGGAERITGKVALTWRLPCMHILLIQILFKFRYTHALAGRFRTSRHPTGC